MKSGPFRFLGYDWKLMVVKKSKHLLEPNGDRRDASYDYTRKTIWIDALESDERQRSALYHELHHAIFAHYRMNIPNEEEVILALENAMMAVIKDNGLDFR
jgi:Zn-dependent peptidase ImmA (M78 family)